MGKYLGLILVVLLVQACSSQPKSVDSMSQRGMETNMYQPDITASNIGAGNIGSSSLGSQSAFARNMPSESIIYFDFDKSEIRFNDRLVLEQHAAYLVANPQLTVRLEGHADERGSREYNLALGERRALAAKRVLNILGVPDHRVNTISYGKERPIVMGNNESAWQRNRRVEIVY